jgi:hypothetical protein
MDSLEEPARFVIEEYRRRFSDPLNVPVDDLGFDQRSRLIAALERALQRNFALLDFELVEFEVSRRRKFWLRLRRLAGRLVRRRNRVI